MSTTIATDQAEPQTKPTTFRIIHKTEYRYDAPASLCYNEARLLPRTFSNARVQQLCLTTNVRVEPAWDDHRERTDFYGNRVLYYSIRQPHEAMSITVTSRVQLLPIPSNEVQAGSDRATPAASQPGGPPWESVRAQLRGDLAPAALEARQFVMSSPLVPILPEAARYAATSFSLNRPIISAAQDLMARIYRDFTFMPGVTTIATPLEEVLTTRRGVCQDFAQLMIGCLRAQGLAARYVSGYLETLPPPGQVKLQGVDASHAWCALYVPDVGWLDFDPTNNLTPHDQHITLGWGRDFADVTPLKGIFFGDGRHQLKVSVDMERVDG
ncbi:MAG: transglutaminase family protein [Caldilineaceae bacterium]